MQKRGQITIFIIVGIVVLISTAIVIFLTETETGRQINEKLGIGIVSAYDLSEIDDYITSCIDLVAYPLVTNISQNGGSLNSSLFRLYNHQNYNYLCQRLSGFEGCVNMILTRQDMEDELSLHIKQGLLGCIDLESFREKGFVISEKEMDVDVKIRVDDVQVILDYPLALTRENKTTTKQTFMSTVKLPLGRLYDLANFIVNSEITGQGFEQERWMYEHDASIIIEKHRPYPDTVYSLSDIITFNFALGGKHLSGSIAKLDMSFGCCFNPYDNNCFMNAPGGSCTEKEMIYENTCICQGFSYFEISAGTCDGRQCQDCSRTYSPLTDDMTGQARLHGESWCVYENLYGDGRDTVGSRHFKHYCIDGDEYVEECTDYREQICEQTELIIDGQQYSDARCRINRWNDCTGCAGEQCCLDLKKDCVWDSGSCYPLVPPGTRFWEFGGMEICSEANQEKTCDGLTCDQTWIDSAARLCFSLGDCGNYLNVLDEFTSEGYLNTDRKESASVYEAQRPSLALPMAQDTGYDPFHERFFVTDIIGILTSTIEYLDSISAYSLEDYMSALVDIDLKARTYCLPWSAPSGASQCQECNDDIFRPCSEYRCKSIGRDCGYEEIDGVGYCFDFLESDNQAPVIGLDFGILADGYSVSETSFMNYKGYKLDQGINPFQEFSFGIKTDEPTQCKITYIPGREYDKLKPFGFDMFVFDTDHRLSIRLPDDRDLNRKLLNLFNADDLDRIITLIDGFEERIASNETLNDYRDQFEAVLRPFKDIISTHVERVRFRGLLDMLKTGQYYLFIKCIDRAGNSNEDDFFITFTMASPPIKAPEILYSSPPNGSISDNFSYMILTDMLGECRFDYADIAYDLMRYSFSCPESQYDIVSDLGGTYRCDALITVPYDIALGEDFTIYSRCSQSQQKHSITFTAEIPDKSADDYVYEQYVTRNSSLLEIDRSVFSVSRHITIGIEQDAIVRVIPSDGCRVSANQTSFDKMDDNDCNFSAALGTYHVAFLDGTEYLKSIHSHESTYNLKPGLAIIHVGPRGIIEGDDRKVTLEARLNLDIFESGAICGYSEFQDQGVLPMAQSDNHTYQATVSALPGDNQYYLRCWDKSSIVKTSANFTYLELW